MKKRSVYSSYFTTIRLHFLCFQLIPTIRGHVIQYNGGSSEMYALGTIKFPGLLREL